MGSRSTLYGVLGVSCGAPLTDIRSAYRRRALEVHPDKGGCSEAFHDVVQAFETLSNAHNRAAYDTQLLRASSKSDTIQACSEWRCQRAKRPSVATPQRRIRKQSGSSKDRGLARLSSALAEMERQDRLVEVGRLPAPVRSALLGFMQSSQGGKRRRRESDASTLTVPLDVASDGSEQDADVDASMSPLGSDEEFSTPKGALGKPLYASQSSCDRQRSRTRSPHAKPSSCSPPAASTSRAASLRNDTGCPGVKRISNNGLASYFAVVGFSGVGLQTSPVPSLEVAIGHHSALIAVKQHVMESIRISDDFDSCIRRAVVSVREEPGVAPDSLHILSHVIMHACSFLGSSKVICGRLNDDIETTLQQRRQFITAKQSGWTYFRDAWIQLLQTPPRDVDCHGRGTFKQKTSEEAVAMVDAAWAGAGETRRQHHKQRAAKACVAVERALAFELKAQVAAAAAVERQQRYLESGLRAARLRWLRDPCRTFDDFLCGLPPTSAF